MTDARERIAYYAYGDYVMFDPGYCEPEIGRITGPSANGNWFVCYHDGCTASSTPADMLRPATDDEIAKASPHIGHHRFDADCPDYIPEACSMCIHDTRKEIGE